MPSKAFGVLNRNQCARGSLNKLGIDNCNNGHWIHRLQNFVMKITPLSLRYKFTRYAKRKIALK